MLVGVLQRGRQKSLGKAWYSDAVNADFGHYRPMASPPRRIPPPPTRFGAGPGQPKATARLARGAIAPPQPYWRTPPAMHHHAAPSTSVQRQGAPLPPRLALRRAGVVQRAEVSLTVPKAKRPVVKCTMGQGVTGYLDRVVLASDRFSSCSPIVLYNEKTRFAGLFHYYAKGLAKQEDALRAFYARVQPTVIYLNDRSVKFEWMTEISRDHEVQQEFFEDVCDFQGKIVMIERKGDSYAVTLDNAGKVVIADSSVLSIHLDYTYGKPEPVAKMPLSGGELETALEGVDLFGKNLWPDGKPL